MTKVIVVTIFVIYCFFKRKAVDCGVNLINVKSDESGGVEFNGQNPIFVQQEIINFLNYASDNLGLITNQVKYVPYTPDQIEMIFMEAENAIFQHQELMDEILSAIRFRNTPLPFKLTDARLIECEQHLLNTQRNHRSGGTNEQYVEQILNDFFNDTTLNLYIDLVLTLFS